MLILRLSLSLSLRFSLSLTAALRPHTCWTTTQFCTHARGVDHRSEAERDLNTFRRAVCGGQAGAGQVPTASTLCHPSHRPCAGDLSKRARELFLLDWWFISDSAAADGFATVAEPNLYANYTILNQQHLVANSHPVIMGHAYWGLHMIWGLGARLRYTGHVGIDFSLGRVLNRGGCRGLKSGCAGRSCTAADALSRPWQPKPLPRMPARPALEFTFGAPQTRQSCGEGYFTCEASSRMCKEESESWEPLDRTVSRTLWLKCTADICQKAGANAYSVRCAGAYLGALTAVWRQLKAAEPNVSIALRDVGYFENGALGWADPSHEAIALSTLTRQAAEMYRSGDGPPPSDNRTATRTASGTVSSGALKAAVKPPVPLKTLIDGCGTLAREANDKNDNPHKRWHR